MKKMSTLFRVGVSIQKGQKHTQKALFFTVIVLIILGNISSAASIGVNFGNNEASLGSTDVAGVVAQANWNPTSGGSGSLSDLVDDGGLGTGANVTWAANWTWHTYGDTSTNDGKLMYGYLDKADNVSQCKVDLSAIPYAQYDLYVYLGSSNNNPPAYAHVLLDGGTSQYSFTNDVLDSPFLQSDYTLTTDTGDGFPAANYAVFSNLTSSTASISVDYQDNPNKPTSDEVSGICAIQIVEANSSAPGRASDPNPDDGTVGVSTTADLSWTAGANATSHDVYFGTTSPGTYQLNQSDTTFDPGVLTNNTTYYWRIDEVNVDGTTTGLVWSFTTAALEATNPSPSNGTVGLSADSNLSWVAGEYALSHDVYFGTSQTDVANAQRLWGDINGDGPADILDLAIVASQWLTDPGAVNPSADIEFNNKVDLDDFATLAADWQTTPDAEFIGNQTGITFDPGTLAYNTTYYWRVDEVNMSHPDSPWTGPVWSFTTAPETLTISNVNPATYVVGNLAVDQLVYFDRTYTFTNVGSLGGSTYIQTSNEDKLSSGDSFLTFYTSKNAIVYVGHDNGISPKPSWMNTFVDTGETLGTTDKSLRLYYKEFPAGTITLGGNGGVDDSCSMYSVVVIPAPTSPPTQASAPNPADSATDVSVNIGLSWTPGDGAFSRDVYFGTSNPPAFQDTQTAQTYNPGTLDEYTTYYWRVDEKNSIGTTTGPVWSFTTGKAPSPGEVVFPGYGVDWLVKAPAELGCDSAKLDQLASNIGGNGIIIRQGYVVKTWGDQTAKADWASAMKPVMSTLLFYAVEEGLLTDVHELIGDHGWTMSTKDQTMEFYHLANMTSGYMRPETPGSAWAYNDYAITLYGKTLFDNVYGTTPDVAATNANRLGALGFQDGTLFGSRGGYGIETSVRDFARIGWFWANKGYWNGTQLLPQHYFDDYMKAQVPSSTPRTSGSEGVDYLGIGTLGGGTDQTANGPGVYGFNWWCNPNQSNWPDAPADTVQADGHWGLETMSVIPSLGVVIATYGGNMGTHNTGDAYSAMNQNLKLLTEACPPPVATGYIQVDPTNPARMVYSNTYEKGHLKPVCFAGPGDPEDFFYNDTANNLSLLTSRPARCTYITAVLQDFGGGNPGTGSALDAKLDEWEGYITQLEDAGVITVFFFFDDSQPLTSNWEELVDKCVAKFKHHKLLIWSVAEEYGEALTTAQVSAVAARIKAQDSNDHVVGVHQNDGNSFAFASDSNIDMYLMQRNLTSASGLHDAVKTSNVNGTKIINLAEVADHASQTQTTVRQWNWAAIMGGASAVQVLWMGRASDPADWNAQGKYDDCARLMDFMESTNLNVTATHDELARGETDYVLADPGNVYIVYGDAVTASLGVNIVAGTYQVKWFDPIDGDVVDQGIQTLAGGDQTFNKPAAIGTEAALSLELGVEPADILASEDCSTRGGVNYNAYNGELGLLVKGSGDYSWIEFTLGSIPVTQATLSLRQDDGGLTASWDITVRGAEFTFDETTFTGTTDTSSWTVIGVIQNVTDIQPVSLDITDFYNNNLGKTVTLQLKCDSIPDGSNGPVFQDRELTRQYWWSTNDAPKISIQ